MATEDIFVNVNAPTLAASRVVSSTNNQAEPWRKFVISDLRDFNLYFTDGAGAYVDVSAYTDFRVGVGGINNRPTGGTWQFTHGGNDEDFAYDVSASSMESTLDAAPYSLGVSVTSPVGGVWIVKFDAVGSQTLPTTDAASLTPDSVVSVKRLVTGDGSTKEEWIIRTFQTPWAYSETWSAISNGVTGSLIFGTENMYDAMGTSDSLAGYFEIELTDASANISTVIQAPVTVQGPVIGYGATGSANQELSIPKEVIILAITANTADVATGTGLQTFRLPYAMTLQEVRASVTTASADGLLTVDINETATTVLSTKLTIDSTEKTSTTAAAAAVISDSALADDAEITIDVDGMTNTAAKGLKVYLKGQRA